MWRRATVRMAEMVIDICGIDIGCADALQFLVNNNQIQESPSFSTLVVGLLLCFSASRPQQKAAAVIKHHRICVSPPATPQRVIRIINISQSNTPFLLLSNLSSGSTLHLMLPLFIYWWSRWQCKVPAVRGWQFGGGVGWLLGGRGGLDGGWWGGGGCPSSFSSSRPGWGLGFVKAY